MTEIDEGTEEVGAGAVKVTTPGSLLGVAVTVMVRMGTDPTVVTDLDVLLLLGDVDDDTKVVVDPL